MTTLWYEAKLVFNLLHFSPVSGQLWPITAHSIGGITEGYVAYPVWEPQVTLIDNFSVAIFT